MTIQTNKLFLALASNNYADLWKQFREMTLYELVAAGTAAGPARLREVMRRFVDVPQQPVNFAVLYRIAPSLTPAAQNTTLANQIIPEILAQAFNDLSARGLGPVFKPISNSVKINVGTALGKIHATRKLTQQITIYRDLTNTLPAASKKPPPLTDKEYQAMADRNDISLAAIKAVAQVESAGSGFDASGRPMILFEAHHFSKHTKHLFDITHPHLSTKNREDAIKYYNWDQYNRLYEAMLLDPKAACMSASWGKFQVLGSNHNGWPDPILFAKAMCQSEENHLKTFEAYCKDANLIRYLKTKNWASFAAGYNGSAYRKHSYDTKIAAAYKACGGK
jgi:N-acetylmuramidase